MESVIRGQENGNSSEVMRRVAQLQIIDFHAHAHAHAHNYHAYELVDCFLNSLFAQNEHLVSIVGGGGGGGGAASVPARGILPYCRPR